MCIGPGCSRDILAREMCALHYQRWLRKGRVEIPTPTERFWANVNIRGTEECWEWTRSRKAGNYGQVNFQGTLLGAHQVAHLLTYGPILPGFAICHSCDNPPCCNPKHLFVGSRSDNMRDSLNKGRGRWQTRAA